MSNYKLTYFDWTGLAEISRLIFALADVPFEDFRIELDEHFPSLSPEWKAKLPWGQVPILEVDGVVIAQSATINRFLARRFNLIGKDEFEWAKADELVDAIMEYAKEFAKFAMEVDEVKKEEILKNCLEVVNPKYLDKFSKIVEENGGKHLVGLEYTWADVYLCHLIPFSEKIYNIKLTANHPVIQNLIDTFLSDPRIQKWYSHAPKTPSFSSESIKDIMKKRINSK